MKNLLLILSCFCAFNIATAQTPEPPKESTEIDASSLNISKPLFKPFIERYILDEQRQLRIEQQNLKIQLAEKVARAELRAADRALSYTADTTNNIFYTITIAATLVVLFGWRSLRDIRETMETITEQKITALTQEYENRLEAIERKARERSEQIINTQQEISNTNQIHSLWMRSGIAKSEQEKISIYDEILEINPEDIEALTYKADTLLDIDEDKWSLSLSNQAIELDSEYALAYWQRACAKAKLEKADEAVEDIKIAIELTESLKEEIMNETYFKNLKDNVSFQQLMGEEETEQT